MSGLKLKNFIMMMAAFAVSAMLVFPIVSCFDDDDDDEDSATIVGLWKITKITVGTVDMALTEESSMDCNYDDTDDVTFTRGTEYTRFESDGTTRDYTQISDINVVNSGICDTFDAGIYFCSDDDETYTVSGNTITWNAGTGDESEVTYTLSGNSATISFVEDSTPITVIFQRADESEVADAIENCDLDL